jgi:hypothetical protein
VGRCLLPLWYSSKQLHQLHRRRASWRITSRLFQPNTLQLLFFSAFIPYQKMSSSRGMSSRTFSTMIMVMSRLHMKLLVNIRRAQFPEQSSVWLVLVTALMSTTRLLSTFVESMSRWYLDLHYIYTIVGFKK